MELCLSHSLRWRVRAGGGHGSGKSSMTDILSLECYGVLIAIWLWGLGKSGLVLDKATRQRYEVGQNQKRTGGGGSKFRTITDLLEISLSHESG